MKKISLIATTVLTGLLLFPSVNDTTTHAAEVTSQDAQAVAIQAMKNSGGNPDLQNFKKVKDKGDSRTSRKTWPGTRKLGIKESLY